MSEESSVQESRAKMRTHLRVGLPEPTLNALQSRKVGERA